MAARNQKLRARLSIDIDGELRRRIKVAAAEGDVSVRDLVVSMLIEALAAREAAEGKGWTAISTKAFARDWASDEDRIYDSL